jgi:iron uptake system component EfeO
MTARSHACFRLSLLGAAASGLLVAAVAPASAAEAGAPVAITVSDKGCNPASVSVPPGKTVFQIKNDSSRAVEWEILKGVMVVEERENILPGFVQKVTATLEAGEYVMTCGLLSNPKGVLKVAAAAAGEAAASISPMDLVGPIAQYKLYVTKEVEDLVASTKVLAEAAKMGDLARAQAAYAPARLHYERIEPVAELFSDLDARLDAREDDFEKKAADPNFIGFHRLEKGLFGDKSTADLAPVADKLMSDLLDLQQRVADLVITPKAMVGGAAELIEEVASKKISGEEDRYSRTDLWDFQANIDGAQKIVDLLRPLVNRKDRSLDQRVRDNFAKVDALLAKYRSGQDGFESYEKLSAQDRIRLKGPVTVLAEDLSALKGTLGVE